MTEFYIKTASLVHDDDTDRYGIDITYIRETEGIIEELRYPFVPINLYNSPRFGNFVLKNSREVDIGFGKTIVNNFYPETKTIYHKVHSMTLEEIEDYVGFPINIIKNDPDDQNEEPMLQTKSNSKILSKANRRIALLSEEEYLKRSTPEEIVEEEQSDYNTIDSAYITINTLESEENTEEGSSTQKIISDEDTDSENNETHEDMGF